MIYTDGNSLKGVMRMKMNEHKPNAENLKRRIRIDKN